MATRLLIYITSVVLLGSIIRLLVGVLGTSTPHAEKNSAYECGFEPYGGARDTFDVQFYLVGLMFLIFDVEIAFLFPWAVLVLNGSKARLLLIMRFSLIRIVGFVLETRMGARSWKERNLMTGNALVLTGGSQPKTTWEHG